MRVCSKISILQYCILLDCCCSLYLDSANFVLNCAVVRDGTGGLAMESADCPTRFRCGGIGDNQPLTGNRNNVYVNDWLECSPFAALGIDHRVCGEHDLASFEVQG